jgi:hypothetical protein
MMTATTLVLTCLIITMQNGLNEHDSMMFSVGPSAGTEGFLRSFPSMHMRLLLLIYRVSWVLL